MKVSSGGSPASTVPDEELRSLIAEQVPCPFMASLAKSGGLPMDSDGMVKFDDLRSVLKARGLSLGAREILVRGTKGVEEERLAKSGKLLIGMEIDAFSITKLQQTTLMHTGDLGIRRGGFHQERLDELLSYSSDGQTLTLKDLAAAQKARVAKDPGTRGHVIGLAEIAALLRKFGTRNASGDKALSKETLTKMFRDAEFPTDVPPAAKLGVPGLFASMAKLAFHQLFTHSGRAAAGHDKAVGQSPPLNLAASSLGKAICPVGGQAAVQPSSAKEAGDLHSKR